MNKHPHTAANTIAGKGGDIVMYKAKDGRTSLDVRLDQDTVWLTQKQMAELFGKDTDTIGLHIRNAYKENELEESPNDRGMLGSSIGGQTACFP